MNTFKETFADKSTAVSKLNFSESTFAYAEFNQEQNSLKIQVDKKFKKVTVTDQRKPKLYIVYRVLPK